MLYVVHIAADGSAERIGIVRNEDIEPLVWSSIGENYDLRTFCYNGDFLLSMFSGGKSKPDLNLLASAMYNDENGDDLIYGDAYFAIRRDVEEPLFRGKYSGFTVAGVEKLFSAVIRKHAATLRFLESNLLDLVDDPKDCKKGKEKWQQGEEKED